MTDMQMHKVLVLNAKGGSGKTTIATNLAACYAQMGHYPALLDYDLQGTALNWLSQRSADYPPIHAVEAYKHNTTVTRSWQMRLPNGVDRMVIDTPAAITGARLSEYIRQANTILIPVLPSPIDVHNAMSFIKDILTLGKVRSALGSGDPKQTATRLGVIANRVMENTRVYHSLMDFLDGLNLPLVTSLRDSQYYVHAFVEGIGIHEVEDDRTLLLKQQWRPLYDWIEDTAEGGRPALSQSSTIESLSSR